MWQSMVGIIGLTVLAWLLSENHRQVNWRVAFGGIASQILVCAVLLKTPEIRQMFSSIAHAGDALQNATRARTTFVFGHLGGGPLPFTPTTPESNFILAFQALPMILMTSALSAVLYYWRVLPLIVTSFSMILERIMGIGGAVGLCATASIFVGMVETPLLIRPYLASLSRGELFVVMPSGMATIAGTVMLLYASFLNSIIPDSLGHLLIASLISVPAAVMVAKLMIPDDTCTARTADKDHDAYVGTMDALSRGTQNGAVLWFSITSTLIVLIGSVFLLNGILSLLPNVEGLPLTLQRMMGWLMRPLAWLMGIPWSETAAAGNLLGTKIVLNELIAYFDLAHLSPGALSERSRIIMTYALCGFANLGSLGIMLAGFVSMLPDRRTEIVELGVRALASGTLACYLTGAVVGIFY